MVTVNLVAASAITSGSVQSGYISSGAVDGYFGISRRIQSGTVGVYDFGSGAVIAGQLGSGAVQSANIGLGQVGPRAIASGAIQSGHINASGTPDGTKFLRDDFTWSTITGVGSGAIQSGHVASGVVGTNELASGAVIDYARSLRDGFFATSEPISGVKAVKLSESGLLQIAMAAVSGRMPAEGVVIDNVLSGQVAQMYFGGRTPPSPNMNYSGYVGHSIWVGNSGTLDTAPPPFSGAVIQRVGVPYSQSGLFVNVGTSGGLISGGGGGTGSQALIMAMTAV
jgi:hypothetical protein